MQESKSCALPLGDSPTMIVATATGWIQGFEPWASRATIWRANQLRYTHHRDVIVPFRALTSLAGTRMCSKGFEPPTHGLEGRCSIQLSYGLRRLFMSDSYILTNKLHFVNNNFKVLLIKIICTSHLKHRTSRICFIHLYYRAFIEYTRKCPFVKRASSNTPCPLNL